jgi:hypothetical protein
LSTCNNYGLYGRTMRRFLRSLWQR